MGSEWQRLRLDEITEFIIDCPHSTPKWTDSGVVVLRNQYIRGGTLDLSNPSYTDEAGYEARIKRAVPSENDIVLTREAPMGEVCLIPKGLRCCLGQRMVLLRAKKNVVLPHFLLYVLQSPYLKHQISWNEGTGTTVSNIRIPLIKAFEIPTPPLHVQKKIAGLLSALDKKIELNRQTNQTLESMAQALFKSWFVDFDPVIDNALAAGNEIPEPLAAKAAARRALREQGAANQPHTLPDPIRQLFPSRFQFTEELGWIPEGWKLKQIKEIASVVKGKSYKSSELQTSTTALVTLKSFNRGGGYRLDGLKEYIGDYKPEQEVYAGDLIIAYTDVTQAADVIGKPAMVVTDARYDHLVISLDVAVVRPKEDVYRYFLYGEAETVRFQDHTRSFTTGTTVLHLAKDAVPDYVIADPGEAIVTRFADIVRQYYSAIDLNFTHGRSLESVRDHLLPKLLSGELRIPEAEAEIDDAAALA